METADHPCAACAREQATCCQKTEVLLTETDRARIRAATGRDDFHERRAPADPDSSPVAEEDPLWARAFDPDGTRRILRHRAGGDCVFLGVSGCGLGMEVRPFVCRLYPYEYDHRGIHGVTAHHCPREMRENPALALALLGMNREEAERWRAALYEALAGEGGATAEE